MLSMMESWPVKRCVQAYLRTDEGGKKELPSLWLNLCRIEEDWMDALHN